MKKFILIFIGLCTLLILCSCKNNKIGSGHLKQVEMSSAADSLQTYSDFSYKVENDGIVITHFSSDSENVIIPSEINSKSVKSVGEDSFYQCTDMKSISIPDTVISIEKSAFYRCYSLEKIEIPKYVRLIEGNPFFRCTALTQITVDPENQDFSDKDGVLFNKGKTTLLVYPEGKADHTYYIPDSVKAIAADAFGYYCNFSVLYIGENVDEFPDNNIIVNNPETTLVVKAGSAAEQYAKKHQINYNTN